MKLTLRRLFIVSVPTVTSAWISSYGTSSSSDRTKIHAIPYVESFEEQSTRRLWESTPFSVSTSVIDEVLDEKLDNTGPILIKKASKGPSTSSGYEHLFDSLYKGPSNEMYDYLSPTRKTKDNKCHFMLQIAYQGSHFCGWQTQPNNEKLPAVQKEIEDWLVLLEKDKVNVRVCGRTDAGVHAIGQIARYRSRIPDLSVAQIEKHFSQRRNKSIRCLKVIPVTRSFHPSFGAESRAYIYLIDTKFVKNPSELSQKLHQQLQMLQGKELDFISLSYGKLKSQTSLCTLYHSQACLVLHKETGLEAIAIELVGDRFLRRMVRMLVENCLRATIRPNSKPDELLEHVQSLDRTRSGKSAPPDGLIFVGATFEHRT